MAADSKPAMWRNDMGCSTAYRRYRTSTHNKEVYSSLFNGNSLQVDSIYSGMNFKFKNHVDDRWIRFHHCSAGNRDPSIPSYTGMLVAMMNSIRAVSEIGRSEDKNSPWRTVLDRYSRNSHFRRRLLNCLTVGSVMKPLTDNISRAKPHI